MRKFCCRQLRRLVDEAVIFPPDDSEESKWEIGWDTIEDRKVICTSYVNIDYCPFCGEKLEK